MLFRNLLRPICRMFFVAADHIHLKHRDRAIQGKARMADIVAAAQQTLLFSGPRTQQNASRRPRAALAKSFRQLEKRGCSRAIVICAVPNLSEGFPVVVVVRADDHDLASKRGIGAFDQAQDILRLAQSPLDINCEHGGDIRLRLSEFRHKLAAGIRRKDDNRDLWIIRDIDTGHWRQANRKIVPEILGQTHNATAASVRQILNDNCSDGPSVLQLPPFCRVCRKFRIIRENTVFKLNRDLSLQIQSIRPIVVE